jgi:MFS family permease
MSSLPFTFSSIYGLSASQTGYVMMAPAVGMVLGSVLPDVLVNRLNKTGKGQTDEVPKPERRLTLKLLVPATIFFTGGLLLYGWAAELRFHIAVTITGLFLFALGLAWLGYCSTTYLIDCYPRLAATTTALGYLLGSILNGLLPLAGLGLFNKAGMGRGSTILAVLSLVSSFMFIVCRAMGEHLRERFGPDR